MLIEANDLSKLLENEEYKNNTVILDASWYLPNQNRDPYMEFKDMHIPNALYFDIDTVCDISSDLPHTIPTKNQFEMNVNALGIKNNSNLIIYSMDGIGTSPRAWWLFKLFGHNKVSILNGGMKAWLKTNGAVSKTKTQILKTNYIANFNIDMSVKYNDVTTLYKDMNYQIVDARSEGRFLGKEEEPRPGLRKGHIPNSINIPFNEFINEHGCLINKNDIIKLLNIKNFNFDKKTISTCGSGVTACILAFALEYIGKNNWSIYDGSWSEWGSKKQSIIEI